MYFNTKKELYTNIEKFNSANYINLGEDIDRIIQNYINDLNKCYCESCISYNKIFELYYKRKKLKKNN